MRKENKNQQDEGKNMLYKKITSFFKQVVFYISYLFVGITACFFSFIIVVNFLSPALSKEPATPQKKKTLKNAIKDTANNIKSLFQDTFKDNTQNPPQKGPSESPQKTPPTNQPSGVQPSQPKPSAPPPQAPKNFEGDTYGNTIPKNPQNKTQASKTSDSSSMAIIEVQSYMAPFIYESTKEKDPFEDPTIKKSEKIVVIVPRTPPEKYDLKEIKLRGLTWSAIKAKSFAGTKTFLEPKALFELPNNGGFYTLRTGDRIGKQGVIFAIRESEVVVVERTYVGSGKERKEKRTIKIKKMDRLGPSASI